MYLLPLISSLASNGGKKFSDESMLASAAQMYKTGLSAEATGRYIGIKQQTGMFSDKNNELYGQGGIVGGLMTAFGKSNASNFVNELSDIFTKGMTMGIRNGADYFKSTVAATYVSNLGTYGNASFPGAQAITNKALGMNQRLAGGVKSGMDAWLFMQTRQKGDTYADTLRRASESSPDLIYQQIKTRANGDPETIRENLIAAGFGVQEADRMIEADTGVSAAAAIRAQKKAAGNRVVGGAVVPLSVTPAEADQFLASQKAIGQIENVGIGVSSTANKIKSGVMGTNAPATEYQKQVWGSYTGSNEYLPPALKRYMYIQGDMGAKSSYAGQLSTQMTMYNSMQQGKYNPDAQTANALQSGGGIFDKANSLFSDPAIVNAFSKIDPSTYSKDVQSQMKADKVDSATIKEFFNAALQALRDLNDPNVNLSDYHSVK
jgi:hypothetical protein